MQYADKFGWTMIFNLDRLRFNADIVDSRSSEEI